MRFALVVFVLLLSAAAWAAMTADAARVQADTAVEELVVLQQRAADAYYHHGDFSNAVICLERITVLDPQNFDAYACAAWLVRSTPRKDEAPAMYARLVAAFPDRADAYLEFALYYRAQRNYAEALPWAEKAIAHGLPSPQRHLYGHLLRKLERHADALAFWQRVLAEEPENAVAQREVTALQALINSAPPVTDIAP